MYLGTWTEQRLSLVVLNWSRRKVSSCSLASSHLLARFTASLVAWAGRRGSWASTFRACSWFWKRWNHQEQFASLTVSAYGPDLRAEIDSLLVIWILVVPRGSWLTEGLSNVWHIDSWQNTALAEDGWQFFSLNNYTFYVHYFFIFYSLPNEKTPYPTYKTSTLLGTLTCMYDPLGAPGQASACFHP